MTPADITALLAAVVAVASAAVAGLVGARAGGPSARRRDRELLAWWVAERARVVEDLEHLADVTEYLATQAQARTVPFAAVDAATAMAVAARQEGCSDAYRTAADMVRGLAVPRS